MNSFEKTSRRQALALSASLAALSLTGPSFAQSNWPRRPIKWIVSQPAGAGPDIIARFIAERLAASLGQAIVIENRPGGQNVIGAQAAARSAPDGYTFFFGTTAAMVTNSFTFKSLPYDPEKDFVPVALVGRSPFVIATSAATGPKTLAEAIARAKAQPGKMSISTDGPKTFGGMLADTVAAMAGIELNHVPYTKVTDGIQDVLAGRVDLISQPDSAVSAYLKGGQLRALAVSTGERVAALPQVPSLSDTFPGFEFSGWNALFAPAGTPADIVARMNQELATLLKHPEVIARLLSLGSLAQGGLGVAAVDVFMKAERTRWASTAKLLNITPE